MTEKLLTGTLSLNTNKQNKILAVSNRPINNKDEQSKMMPAVGNGVSLMFFFFFRDFWPHEMYVPSR